MADHYRNEADVFLSDLGRQKNSFPVFEKMELRFSMNSTFGDTVGCGDSDKITVRLQLCLGKGT